MYAATRKYVIYLLRRIWLVAIIAIVFGLGAFIFVSSSPVSYQAEAKIFIGSALDSSNPDINTVTIPIRLAPTYAELAVTTNVLKATIANLNLDTTPERLERRISTRPIIDTAILVIRVIDTNPDRAVAIVNEHAKNLIDLSPSALTEDEEKLLDITRQQITDIHTTVVSLTDEINQILLRITEAEQAGNPREVEILREDYNGIQDQIAESRRTQAQLLDTFSSYAARVNRLELFEAASSATEASGIGPRTAGVLGVVFGAGITVAGLLLFLEYFDDNLRTEKEVVRAIELPVMGEISRADKISREHTQLLTSGALTREAIAEQYRIVQTNLLLSSESSRKGGVYVIASPNPQEGRSFTVANLAVIMAEYGLKVLLVDANFRSPRLHQLFELDNKSGLAGLLAVEEYDSEGAEALLHKTIQSTATPRLNVLTSGLAGVEISSRILGFEVLSNYVSDILARDEYDVILFDTPPCITLADSYIVATAAQASVILIVESARTSRVKLLKAKEQFLNVKSTISGVIVNKV